MGRKAIERERKRDRSKTEKWIKKLFPYFQEKGLKGITMDLVAKELHRSKTTVYEYFQSKEELLELTVDYKLNQIRGFEKILQDQSKPYVERSYGVLKYQAEHISDISNLFLSDLRTLYPELWKKIEEFLDEVVQKVAEFYKEGIREQAFKPIHTAILASSDRFFFRLFTNPDFLHDHGLTIQEAFDQYMNLKFFGLVNTDPKNS